MKHPGYLGFVLLVVACSDEIARPTVPTGTPSTRPQLSLIPYDTTTLGVVAGELTITVPTGAVVDSAVLYAPGAVAGASSLELLSAVTLSGGGTIPANEFTLGGESYYYRPNGDQYRRRISVSFTYVPSGVQDGPNALTTMPSNPLVLRDTLTATHGIKVVWEFSEETSTGQNANDPNFFQGCSLILLGSGLCVAAAGFEPERQGGGPPVGTIRVRAYGVPQAPGLSLACVPGGAVERGTSITCTASVSPATDTLRVTGWRFIGDSIPEEIVRIDSVSNTTWTGPLATPGRVVVAATINSGAPVEDTAIVQVAPRNWAGRVGQHDPAIENSPGPLREQPEAPSDLGRVEIGLQLVRDTAIARLVRSGPNETLTYFAEVPFRTPQPIVRVNTVALATNSLFWQRQRASRSAGYCDRNDVVAFPARVRLHEGLGTPPHPDSHLQIFRDYVDSVGRRIGEPLVLHGSTNVRSILDSVADAAIRASAVIDDTTAGSPGNNRNPSKLPCRFDYFPSGGRP